MTAIFLKISAMQQIPVSGSGGDDGHQINTYRHPGGCIVMQVMKDLAIDPSYLQPGGRKILPDSTKLHCRRTPDPVLAQQ